MMDYLQLNEELWRRSVEDGTETEWLRMKCRTDVFFLLFYIIGRKDICYVDDRQTGRREYRPWLFERCMEVQSDPDGHLDIWARDHYKSTIITYAMTIQEILRDPEITICIISYNSSTAGKMVGQIKNTLESNQMLLHLFPDILFDNTNVTKWVDDDGAKHDMVWSSEWFNVKRRNNPKEHTCEFSGLVNGQKIGGHYNLLIYDDVVIPESVSTSAQILKTTQSFSMSLNIASSTDYRIRMIGTRYSLDDTYSEIIKKGIVKPRIYPCFDADGEPVLYTREVLDTKRRMMIHGVWESQMLCNPQANSIWKFSREWIPPFIESEYIRLDEWNWYIIVDPAGNPTKRSDYTVMWVLGATPERQYAFVELVKDKLTLEQKQDRLF